MNRRIFAGLLCLVSSIFFLPTASFAEQTSAMQTDEVIVTAARIPQRVDDVLADMTVIEKEEIERAGQSTLVELLQMQPGVEISSNGGAGKASSIFLRGTNSDHVVVLVDGLRINSATLGTTSFENLPLGQIERIEILRGPASSLYGADAIGGVIQIFTKRAEKGINYSAFLGYGSYNTKRAEANVSGGNDNTRFSVNASGLKTNGFSAKNVTTGFDADADPYHNLALTASLTQKVAEGHELEAQFFQSKGRSDYDCNKSICVIDQTLRSYGLTSRNRFLPFWNSTLKLGLGVDDSTDQAGTAFSAFRTEQRQATWQNDFTLPLGMLTLAYDRLEQEVSGTTNYTVKARDNNGWLASYLADIGAHSVQASLRHDDNSQYGQHTTGGLGYGYRITPQWRATASFGTAFKAPTFNQLYFPNFGDPTLQPETSRNREIGLRYDNSIVKAGLTVFDNQIKNLIEFSGPATAGCTLGGFCPVNVGKAEIRGATFDGGWWINDHWTLRGNFTVQSPEDDATNKLLIRRGHRHGAMDLSWRSGAWQFGAETTAVSKRYNNATNTKRMEGYALVNLTASYAFYPDWMLEARANNIFDKDYVLAYTGNTATSAAYETPGANVFVGIRWQPE
jgi:vitamin B12 transporter